MLEHLKAENEEGPKTPCPLLLAMKISACREFKGDAKALTSANTPLCYLEKKVARNEDLGPP